MRRAKGQLDQITVTLGIRRRLVGRTIKQVIMVMLPRRSFAFVRQPPMLAHSSAVFTGQLTLQMLTILWLHRLQ